MSRRFQSSLNSSTYPILKGRGNKAFLAYANHLPFLVPCCLRVLGRFVYRFHLSRIAYVQLSWCTTYVRYSTLYNDYFSWARDTNLHFGTILESLSITKSPEARPSVGGRMNHDFMPRLSLVIYLCLCPIGSGFLLTFPLAN